jgi:hypothetical protein
MAELLTSNQMDRLYSQDGTLLEHKSPWQSDERVTVRCDLSVLTERMIGLIEGMQVR